MKNKLGVILDYYWQKCEMEGGISVLMVGFQSPGIELPWRRSALSKCSCFFMVKSFVITF